VELRHTTMMIFFVAARASRNKHLPLLVDTLTLEKANMLDPLTCAHVVVVDVAAPQVSVHPHPPEEVQVMVFGEPVVVTYDLPHQPVVVV